MVGRMVSSCFPQGLKVTALSLGLVFASISMAEAQQQRPQAAQQPRAANNAAGTFKLEQFGDWIAAISGQGRAKVCYAMAEPKDRLPKGLKRDPAHIFVSTRVGDGAKNEIAIRLGFSAKPREDGTLTIGNAKFALLTEGENAFLKNPAQEAQLLDAMRKGQTVQVQVSSARGNALTDRYILKGFGQAVDRMAKECP
ncbi:MAG: invasion associated locus B family protein [Rhabdaerophilum sp.]